MSNRKSLIKEYREKSERDSGNDEITEESTKSGKLQIKRQPVVAI